MIINEHVAKDIRLVFKTEPLCIPDEEYTQTEIDIFIIKIHDNTESFTLLETTDEDEARTCWSLLAQAIIGG